jgi:hypothetical protein
MASVYTKYHSAKGTDGDGQQKAAPSQTGPLCPGSGSRPPSGAGSEALVPLLSLSPAVNRQWAEGQVRPGSGCPLFRASASVSF